MFSDLKLALRQLRKSPGFALTAIVTLALGIGANAVVFSVLNAVVLRPLNVPEAQNVYTVQRFQYPSQSYPDYLDLRDRNRTFESLMTFQIIGPVGVDTGKNPSIAWPYLASGNYFDGLGIQPYLGRFFHASDEKGPNSAPYVVLSYAYWHGHFVGDKSVIGRKVDINKHPFTIMGVAPPSFRGTELVLCAGDVDSDRHAANDDGQQHHGSTRQSLAICDWAAEAGGNTCGSDGGSEFHRRMAVQDLSCRRRWLEVHPEPSGTCRRHAGWTGARVHGWLDAAGRADTVGSLCQSGKSVSLREHRTAQKKLRCGWHWDRGAG